MTTYDKIKKWEADMAEKEGPMRPKYTIIELLNEYLEQIPSLKQEPKRDDSGAFEEWQSAVEASLRELYGADSSDVKRFNEIRYHSLGAVVMGGDNVSQFISDYQDGLERAAGLLRSVIRRIEKMGVPEKRAHIPSNSALPLTFSPVFNQHQVNTPEIHLNQSQHQSQEQSVSLEQTFEHALQVIEENYGAEHAAKAQEQLESLKTNKSWENAKGVMSFLMGLGKIAFGAALPYIIQVMFPQLPPTGMTP